PPPCHYFSDCMILAPQNTDVFEIDDKVLSRMHGQSHTYYSADKLICKPGANPDVQGNNRQPPPIPLEFIRDVDKTSLSPGTLTLK
ncbi:hypothetical protein BJ912DRAFT_827738, partial [Pholiota molesta]